MRWWDIRACHALEQQLFDADPWSEPLFWSELAGVPDTRHYVVAAQDDEIVGYAGLMAVAGEADVQTIAVAADRQGSGLGGRLLTELIDEAGRRGCRSVTLEVRADNAAARRLYTRFGFATIAVRSGYYGPGRDGVVMRRG
jgi:ribosomal-protein-alanine N-acetyltransferase